MKPILSPTIHEDVVAVATELKADEVLHAMHDAAAACRIACEKSIEASEPIRANQMQSALANERQLRHVSFRHFNAAAEKVDKAREKADRAIAELEKSIAAPPPPKDGVGQLLASEIRSAFSRMSSEERNAAFVEAQTKGDDVVLGAILNAPALLTGFFAEELEARRGEFQRVRYGKELQRIGRLEKARSALAQVSRLSMAFTNGLTDSEAISKAEQTEAIARAAAAVV
jgi:hypothetical protein